MKLFREKKSYQNNDTIFLLYVFPATFSCDSISSIKKVKPNWFDLLVLMVGLEPTRRFLLEGF